MKIHEALNHISENKGYKIKLPSRNGYLYCNENGIVKHNFANLTFIKEFDLSSYELNSDEWFLVDETGIVRMDEPVSSADINLPKGEVIQEAIDYLHNMPKEEWDKLKVKLATISEQTSDTDKLIQSMSKIDRNILNEPMTI